MFDQTVDLAIVTMPGIFSSGRINMPNEQELPPPDNERVALSEAAKWLKCSDSVLQVAARAGKLPTAKKMGYMWTVEYGPVRDWYNREKHPGGRPKNKT